MIFCYYMTEAVEAILSTAPLGVMTVILEYFEHTLYFQSWGGSSPHLLPPLQESEVKPRMSINN